MAALRFGASWRLAGGWSALGLALILGCGGAAQAQDLPAPSLPSASVPAPAIAPGSPAGPPQFANVIGNLNGAPLASPVGTPATPPPAALPHVEMGPIDVIYESLFGDPNDPWRPLPLSTFFTEGWLEPWDYPTSGSGGAPRQGWINAFDGVFYRLWFLDFTYYNDWHRNGSQYLGDYTIFTPISRRFQLRFDVPFIVSNRGGASNTYHGNSGDFVVTPRFMLSESKDFTQVLACGIRTPTGRTENGNGQTALIPQYEFWYGGLPNGWVVRGGTGMSIPTNNAGGGRTVYNYDFAVGKYWTPHDATPIGDLVTYVSILGYSTVDNRGSEYSFLSLTPGYRCHLGNNWYLLGGVEIPVTGPRTQGFAWAPTNWLMKVY